MELNKFFIIFGFVLVCGFALGYFTGAEVSCEGFLEKQSIFKFKCHTLNITNVCIEEFNNDFKMNFSLAG